MEKSNRRLIAEEVIVREAKYSDITQSIAVHEAAFPGFFLTQLGAKFLKQLYLGFLEMPSAIFLVAEKDNQVIGFVAGTTNPNAHFSQLLKERWYRFLLASVGGLFKNPIFVMQKCLSAFIYKGENPEQIENATLLSSIATLPEFEGQGVGRILTSEFIVECKNQNVEWLYLTTDRVGNDSVNAFYLKNDFKIESSFRKTGNREMNRYVKKI